jgi:hypothetical protein
VEQLPPALEKHLQAILEAERVVDTLVPAQNFAEGDYSQSKDYLLRHPFYPSEHLEG